MEYYFFKKGSREYDQSELLAFLTDIKYMSFSVVNRQRQVKYYNSDLDFEAYFIFGSKSKIPNLLVDLNPLYLDTNFYVKFDSIQSTFKVKLLLDIIEIMCRKFNFRIYTTNYKDVCPFNGKMALAAFLRTKTNYKTAHAEQIASYAVVDSSRLQVMYNYLLSCDNISFSLKDERYKFLRYRFYKHPGTRKPYIACILDFSCPIIIPPLINTIALELEGRLLFFDYYKVFKKISKYINLDDYDSRDYGYVNRKSLLKLRKALLKQKQAIIEISAEEIPLNKILDI